MKATVRIKSVLCGVALWLATSVAGAQPPYPDVSDNSHATTGAVRLFRSYFTAKSLHDADKWMSHFSRDQMGYFDATLGWERASFEILESRLKNSLPRLPPQALSYPTAIHGDEQSAIVEFVDTPEFFGGEIRAIGVVQFKGGKIARWADYWDSRHFGSAAAAAMRTPADKFPNIQYDLARGGAASAMVAISQRLSDALAAGNAAEAASLFAPDAVLQDWALRSSIVGRIAIGKYLAKVLSNVPYGKGSKLRNVAGSAKGGGFEWVNESSAVKRGVIALDVDEQGQIVRFLTTWDAGILPDADYESLLLGLKL